MALTTQTAPLTLLQAVNQLLQSIGTAAVMSLDAAVLLDEAVQRAYQTISDQAFQIQEEGWYFNTDWDMPLAPSTVDGSIAVPNGVAKITVAKRNSRRLFAPRFNQATQQMCLWDLKHHTFNWSVTSGVPAANQEALGDGNLYVDMVSVYTFEQVMQPLRYYIMASAGAIYGVGRVPNDETFKFSQTVVEQAMSAWLRADQDQRDLVPEENPHFRKMRRR